MPCGKCFAPGHFMLSGLFTMAERNEGAAPGSAMSTCPGGTADVGRRVRSSVEPGPSRNGALAKGAAPVGATSLPDAEPVRSDCWAVT